MPRKPRQTLPKDNHAPPIASPFDALFRHRNTAQDDLLTGLLRAAEMLAKSTGSLPTSPAVPAAQSELSGQPLPDFARLMELADPIQSLAEDPALANVLSELVRALGENDNIRLLFFNLFPQEPMKPVLGPNGHPLLTEREIDILRIASADFTQQEIATALGISKNVVNLHFQSIYKKLGVHRPMQAVKQAIAMGYLEWDRLNSLTWTAHRHAQGYDPFQTMCATLGYFEKTARPNALSSLGLFLMVAGALVQRQVNGDQRKITHSRGLVCAYDTKGRLLREFGREHLCPARSLAIAPLTARRAGFTPGHLFVAHDLIPQQGLNRGCISEFTATGRFVRTFRGGETIQTRLIGTLGLAFHPDGRLLCTSGWLTDAVLAFTDSGKKVERFTDGHFTHFVGSGQSFYGVQYISPNAIYEVSLQGERVQAMPLTPPIGWCYLSMTVDLQEHFYVVMSTANRNIVQVFDRTGNLLSPDFWTAHHIGRLTVNSQGHILFPDKEANRLMILSTEGQVLSSYALVPDFIPTEVAVAPEGTIYVCGATTE